MSQKSLMSAMYAAQVSPTVQTNTDYQKNSQLSRVYGPDHCDKPRSVLRAAQSTQWFLCFVWGEKAFCVLGLKKTAEQYFVRCRS